MRLKGNFPIASTDLKGKWQIFISWLWNFKIKHIWSHPRQENPCSQCPWEQLQSSDAARNSWWNTNILKDQWIGFEGREDKSDVMLNKRPQSLQNAEKITPEISYLLGALTPRLDFATCAECDMSTETFLPSARGHSKWPINTWQNNLEFITGHPRKFLSRHVH